MEQNRPKVLVGMSGGVDSSVSAALLLEQGYEVIGAFMKNWSGNVHGPECRSKDHVGDEHEECGWRAERRDAMRVAAQLGIPFLTFDFENAYRKNVMDYMFREYESGRTPNPDVMCNKFMKFDLFLKEADTLGCKYIATGHYARVEDGKLLAGVDDNKDQTYFLCQIPKEVLGRVLFPIGNMPKPDVRKKARELGLVVADKKDSQGICFVGEVHMDEFLKAKIPQTSGNIVTTDGEVVGQHDGLPFYTIGQRKGMGIGGGDPYYVVDKRAETNELVVSSNFHQALFKQELVATDLNWFVDPDDSFDCHARIRYRQALQACSVDVQEEKIHVRFHEPQRAVTSGQFIVLYDGDQVLGSGVIV